VRDANRRGLVLAINMADEAMEDFELQNYRGCASFRTRGATTTGWRRSSRLECALFVIHAITTDRGRRGAGAAMLGLRHDELVNIAWADHGSRADAKIEKLDAVTCSTTACLRGRQEERQALPKGRGDLANKKLGGPPAEENY
jgi:hypothetical protein